MFFHAVKIIIIFYFTPHHITYVIQVNWLEFSILDSMIDISLFRKFLHGTELAKNNQQNNKFFRTSPVFDH